MIELISYSDIAAANEVIRKTVHRNNDAIFLSVHCLLLKCGVADNQIEPITT